MTQRRKKKHKEEHIDESWLIPYADLMTLLLALFIVLFSTSSVDAEKFRAMSGVFSELFTGGTGVMDFPSDAPTRGTTMDVKNLGTTAEGEDEDDSALTERELKELEEIQEKIDSYIASNQLEETFETSLSDEGLLILIRDSILFRSGRADVRSEYEPIANELSDLLVMDPPRQIIISGHTDNVPIRTARFDSNWELSVMRSVNFMKLLMKNDALLPQWFSAKGFGEYRPVASNETPEGREKNRRVEILILPRTADTTSSTP
ncbi:flagellar motor protein MotB [Aureibacillus halotolerans]|uniref:Chemotaxis protein MotB n=1 Tax=Aureibacillus halotolerans TaxID=1508390 RepID=A0A4R6U2V6_9BACI|nr:flagellar motor protein MotB [Aureibacillus halotolerans]TDQ37444.1 chemotaxis protein MotB [Aureibacillus halotolerans]